MDAAVVAALITAGASLLITVLSLVQRRAAGKVTAHLGERKQALAEWSEIYNRLSAEVKRLGEALERCLSEKARLEAEVAKLREQNAALTDALKEPPSTPPRRGKR